MAKTVLTFILLLSLASTAFADSLKIVTLSYPPYEYLEKEDVRGIATRVVREVFKRMNVSIEIELLPWVEALEAVRSGRADAVYTAFKTPEREKYLLYPDVELIGQTTAFFVHAGKDIEYNGDLRALSQYRFGVVRGVSYGSLFDDAVKSGLIDDLVVSEEGCESIRRFLAGESDILVSNRLEARTILRNMDREGVAEALSPPLQYVRSYLAFSKKSEHLDLMKEFEATLLQMRMDGSYGRLLQQD